MDTTMRIVVRVIACHEGAATVAVEHVDGHSRTTVLRPGETLSFDVPVRAEFTA